MSEGSEPGGTHRPLPSVRIPLLRDEVRATRMRQAILAGGGGAAVLLTALAYFVIPLFFGDGEPAAAEAAEASVVDTDAATAAPEDHAEAPAESRPERGITVVSVDPRPEQAVAPPPPARTEVPFGTSRGFRPALTNAGCTGEEADQLVSVLDGVLDFRRCRPEHRLILERDPDGVLARFEYRLGATRSYEVIRDADGVYHARQVEQPIETSQVARGGVIVSSLGGALEAAGLGRSLVGVFVEVFERSVNFATHTRSGDTFRMVVEEERVGGELQGYGRVRAIEFHGQRTGVKRAFFYAPRRDLAEFYDETGRAMNGGWLRTPLRYDHISSPFDPRRRHPILRRIVPHNGIDYAASTGTPVWAAAGGEITFIGDRGANGNLVSIRHERGFESHYAHLSRFARGLSRGDRVEQRQVIGYVGSTGRSTGPHLHFGLKRGGRFLDPASELNGPGRMLPPRFRGPFAALVREMEQELGSVRLNAPRSSADAPAEPETTAAVAMD